MKTPSCRRLATAGEVVWLWAAFIFCQGDDAARIGPRLHAASAETDLASSAPDEEHAVRGDRPMMHHQPLPTPNDDPDDLHAKLDGQVVNRRGEACRLEIFGIVHHQGCWWIQFGLTGTESYQGTICVADDDLDRLIPQIESHTSSSSLQNERADPTPAGYEMLAAIQQRPRARDILEVIRDRAPLPDRRRRSDRRATRRGGRRNND